MPPDSPMDPAWTGPASTLSQASKHGVMHRSYGTAGQIDMSLPDPGDGHSVRAYPLEDQTGTMNVENSMDMPTDFRSRSLLYEKMNGGYTPVTAPVGEGMPAPAPTSSTRNAEDTEAIRRMRGM